MNKFITSFLDNASDEISALCKMSLPPLSSEEEKEIAGLAKKGDEKAKDLLVRANLRFVIQTAKKYANHGLGAGELVKEGVIGMMKSLEKYNPERNVRFISFANLDIRNEMLQSINKTGGRIRLPDEKYRTLIKISKAFGETEYISDDEERVQAVARSCGIKKREVEELVQISSQASSLDEKLSASSDNDFHSFLKDEKFVSPEEEAVKACLREQMEREIWHLPPVEKTVLVFYYGLQDTKKRSVPEIAAHFGKTRQWAYQKIAVAEEMLRDLMDGKAA